MADYMRASETERAKAREVARMVLDNRHNIRRALIKHVATAKFSDDVQRALDWAVLQFDDSLKVMFSGIENEMDARAVDSTIKEGQALLRAAGLSFD